MAKAWTSLYLTVATKARLEEYKARLMRQHVEGRLMLPMSEQPGRDGLSADFLINRLLDRVEDGRRKRKKKGGAE